MQYLVLGANGYIGRYLYNHLILEGENVIGTRHSSVESDKLIHFDILSDSIYGITRFLNEKEKTAIICIAQANIDKCKIENELSYQINVETMKCVIQTLIQENFYIIFFSTDNVFDGIKGNYTEQDKTNALNQYGKMKEEMEHFLVANYPQVCIFRLPKVLGTEKERQNMLTNLESNSQNGVVKCIKGSKMSIVSKEDVFRACLIASKSKLHGIYNLCSGEIFSRKELTEKFFNIMGIDHIDIVEAELEEFGFKDIRPLNIGLKNSKFRKETGYEFTEFDRLVLKYGGYSK